MQTRDAPQENAHERLVEIASTLVVELHALQTLLATEQSEMPADKQMLRSGLHEAALHARQILSSIRISGEEFLPAVLNGVSLAEALSRLLEESAEQLALASRISLSGVDEQDQSTEQRLSATAERTLYFVAREALDQVPSHSSARKLRLSLNYGPDEVQMSIEDDGLNLALLSTSSSPLPVDEPLAIPFAMVESTDGIWRELRQQIEYLGGTLVIRALGKQGTRVQASVPYRVHPHDASLSEITQDESGLTASALPQVARVTVLVVDGQAVIRAALNRLLDSYPGLSVIGQAADGVQAVSETLELGPQVVLLDSQLPAGQSLEALRQIKQLNLNTKVLLFSTQEREEYLYEILRAGADGYVLKDIAPDALAEAVRAVARGELLIQPQIASRLLSRVGRGRNDALTTREQEVLRLLARGLRNKEIAARLFVSERTVNFHLANIYQKMNVSGRTEALSKAIEQGLV